MIKILMGGSPCTHWSVAQKNNRETEPTGVGWELFKNYLIAKEKFKPDFFLYENNKSAAQPIKDQISKELGVDLQYINSALVSAQNRQRFYAHNIPNVPQPEDRGILLKDILESGIPCRNEKAYCLDANYYKGGNLTNFNKQSGQRLMVAEPVGITSDGKAYALKANYHKSSVANFLSGGGHYPQTGAIEPVCVAQRGRYTGENGVIEQQFETREDSKTNTLTTVSKDNLVCEPIVLNATLDGKAQCLRASCYKDGIRNLVGNEIDRRTCVAQPIRIGTIENNAKNKDHDSQQYRVYSPFAKSVTLCGNGGGVGAKTGLYACPIDGVAIYQIPHGYNNGGIKYDKSPTLTANGSWQTNNFVIEAADGKTHPVYKVENGTITIKEKSYPIKLPDGYYIIRKLTVLECKRLQTVPDEYIFPVSNTQAYKMLGNGWTVDVIAHILSHIPNIQNEEIEVLSMYDGMSCGRIALNKLGVNITKYYASEIDKYAIQTTMANFIDTIQLGDAFDVRTDKWRGLVYD